MKKDALIDIAAYSSLLKDADSKDDLESAVDLALRGLAPPPAKKTHDDKPMDVHKETNVHVTSPYGKRVHPITGIESFHSGIDLMAPEGTEILAWDSGVVIKVGGGGPSGNFVIIEHDEEIVTSYSHLSKVNVAKGASVHKGQVIGLAGSTGSSTGSHLHFRMKVRNEDVNPATYLSANPVVGGVYNG